MIEKDTMIKVTNRDNGSVTYIIPDLGNLRRTFQSGETKEISMEELRKLMYVPGGAVILKQYLVIDNQDAVAELLGTVEPEYSYTETEILALLNTGSIEQLEDCLTFAPEGVINLVKKYAVDTKLNDIRKRNLIREKTGFDVTSAIEINEETSEDGEENSTTKTRKAAPITAASTSTPVRKVITIAK